MPGHIKIKVVLPTPKATMEMCKAELCETSREGQLTSRRDAVGDCLGWLLLFGLFCCGLFERPVIGFLAEDRAFCCGTGACLAGRRWWLVLGGDKFEVQKVGAEMQRDEAACR